MLPFAIEAEADEARRHFAAVSSAIAGAFQKDGAKPFLEGLDRVKKDVRRYQPRPRRSTASKMLEILGQMGLRVPKLKR